MVNHASAEDNVNEEIPELSDTLQRVSLLVILSVLSDLSEHQEATAECGYRLHEEG